MSVVAVLFLGGSLALRHSAVSLAFSSFDSFLTCFRFLFFGQFHRMIDYYFAVDRLADFDVRFIVIVFIESFDKHYYDENEIEVGKPIQCQIAVNHVVELTTEEKAEARQKALRQYQEEEVRKLQNRNKPRTATKATTQEVQQPSLFDLGL